MIKRMFNVRDFPVEWRIKLKGEAAHRGMTISEMLVMILDGYFRNSATKREKKESIEP